MLSKTCFIFFPESVIGISGGLGDMNYFVITGTRASILCVILYISFIRVSFTYNNILHF